MPLDTEVVSMTAGELMVWRRKGVLHGMPDTLVAQVIPEVHTSMGVLPCMYTCSTCTACPCWGMYCLE